MATIAAHVGGSKATLYNHFSSKEQLFEAVVQEICAGNAAVFETIDLESGDLRKALRRFGVAMTRLILSDDLIAMHRLIAGEAARFPEIGAAYYQAGVRRGKEKLFQAFQSAMDNGRLRHADPMNAAQQFFDLCISGLYRRALWNMDPKPTEAEIDANVDAAVTTFLDGYRLK
jgi:AcrR family transcriptional regulator